MKPIPLDPLFSVSVYYWIIFAFLLMTLFSFLNLNFSKYVQDVKKSAKKINELEKSECSDKLLQTQDGQKVPKTESSDPEADKFEKILLFIFNFLITFVNFKCYQKIQTNCIIK